MPPPSRQFPGKAGVRHFACQFMARGRGGVHHLPGVLSEEAAYAISPWLHLPGEEVAYATSLPPVTRGIRDFPVRFWMGERVAYATFLPPVPRECWRIAPPSGRPGLLYVTS
jgi:hypothetical protein